MIKNCAGALAGIIVLAVLVGSAYPQYDSSRGLEYLKQTFDQNDRKLDNFLLQELEQFLVQFPHGAHAAEVHYMIARLHERRGDKYEALAAYFRALFLFPGSERHTASEQAARRLIANEKDFQKHRDNLLQVLGGSFEGENQPDRYFNYLSFLYDWEEPRLREWAIKDSRYFVAAFPNDQRLPLVLKRTARLYYRKGDYREAVGTYRKLEMVFPGDSIIPEIRFQIATMLTEKLGEHAKAAEVFNRVVTEFPQSDYAEQSLFRAGALKQQRLKDYRGAINDYQKLLEDYPASKLAVEALFAIAEINVSKYKEYRAGIAAYDRIVADYVGDPRSMTALEQAAELYKDKLKEYAKAVDQYGRAAEVFPRNEETPKMLLKAGELSEDKLQDYARAVSFYDVILQKFPNHPKSNEAEKRLAKAREKITQQTAETLSNR